MSVNNATDPNWHGTAYDGVLTFIHFSGVVTPGHQVRFVLLSEGSCNQAVSANPAVEPIAPRVPNIPFAPPPHTTCRAR